MPGLEFTVMELKYNFVATSLLLYHQVPGTVKAKLPGQFGINASDLLFP